MTAFKIATWNVNSLRVRLPQVLTWLQTTKPDVLALQETKLLDQDFPSAEIEAAGYRAVFSGQKTYNGVAILSRNQTSHTITDIDGLEDQQRRILGVTIDDIRILNLYVPNGESITSEKYRYKLNWLEKMNGFLQNELKNHSKMIVLGDFNIAPAALDVHDPAKWEGQVLFSLPERDAFQALLQAGLNDCFRALTPTAQNFTWWDYRLNSFKRNRGLRIDHILASSPLLTQCTFCRVDATPRTWERPSDHAPVVAEFKTPF